MKTLEAPGGTLFRFSSDLSGSLEVEHAASSQRCRIVGSDLLWFVAQYVMDRRIAALEQAEPEEILGLPRRKG